VADLAHRDGFECFGDMLDFWKDLLPFTGQIIHWKPPNRVLKRSYDIRSKVR